MRFRICSPILVAVLLAGSCGFRATAQDHPERLVVDLSSETGPIVHGATGWLYGQSAPGIPTVSTMAPLKPQISAQKPPDGLQHPSGDALQVGADYKKAGGKEIQIYLQDIYPDWPYNHHEIEDYVQAVRRIVKRVMADPNHELFSYVPFNEPEYNWYGYSGAPFEKFLSDWKTIFQSIRELDPSARIVGPNYSNYRSETYRQFLIFARNNHVLPQEISWHELQDSSYPGWYDSYSDYRAVEATVGVPPIPIVINEYTRAKGDLAVPGKMIQWITRLENRKVQACLAYWTPSGTLSDLVARTWPNRVTGAWWVFQWYGAMEGNTVAVTPPDPYGFGLQGIATVEKAKKQARIILGGTSGSVNIQVKGLANAPYLGNTVHASIWCMHNSETEPSAGPLLQQESDFPVSNGEIAIPLAKAVESSAYYIVLTPETGHAPENYAMRGANHYEAQYAELSGMAAVEYGTGASDSGSAFVAGFNSDHEAAVEFPVNVVNDGYYNLVLRANSAATAANSSPRIGLVLNGIASGEIFLQTATGTQNLKSEKKVFLPGGINLVSFKTLPGASIDLHIDSLDVMPATGPLATYDAASSANTFGGSAKLEAGATGSIKRAATLIGAGTANFLQFNGISAPVAGTYKMIVSYTNSEMGHSGQVERYADISVNGKSSKRVYFRNTFDKQIFRTNVIDVELAAGANSVRFSNSDGYAPDLEKIQIAEQ